MDNFPPLIISLFSFSALLEKLVDGSIIFESLMYIIDPQHLINNIQVQTQYKCIFLNNSHDINIARVRNSKRACKGNLMQKASLSSMIRRRAAPQKGMIQIINSTACISAPGIFHILCCVQSKSYFISSLFLSYKFFTDIFFSLKNDAISGEEDEITSIPEDEIEEHTHIALLKDTCFLIQKTKAVFKQTYKDGHFMFRPFGKHGENSKHGQYSFCSQTSEEKCN